MKQIYFRAALLLILLVGISMLKDLITPDYLNTPNATFLNPEQLTVRAISTVFSHPFFWLLSLAYSMVFLALPYFISRMLFDKKQAQLLLLILLVLMVAEYLMVFSGSTTLLVHILPKLNRYLHSPIPVLFFLAAFTVNQRNHGSD